MEHLDTVTLEGHLEHLRAAPTGTGSVGLLVARPDGFAREVLDAAVLDVEVGLVGDNWLVRGSRRRPDGSADPLAQVTVMSHRMVRVLADDPAEQALAGDQVYVDLDLSESHLPAGTRLRLGEAVLQVSETPHTGCAKFVTRFGEDSMRFVNGRVGRSLRLRGLNAWVVAGGRVRVGDEVVVL